MNIKQKDNYILVSYNSGNFTNFISKFKENHSKLEKKHLIIQLSESINTSEEDILVLLKYAEIHKQNGTTFVVVYPNVDVDNFPETFNIAPTLIEAEDILEMEEIQRDLSL